MERYKFSDIVLSDNEMENPFVNTFYLFNTNEGFNYEWHIKTLIGHYRKLLTTTTNLLEVQRLYTEDRDNISPLYRQTSIVGLLEYFFIKTATIFDLLDILYEKYYSITKKNKKEIEKKLIEDFDNYLDFGGSYSELREHYKKEISKVRNRIVHDQGYSFKAFIMKDDLVTFQVYNSEVDELLYPRELYRYPDDVLIEVSAYVTYNFVFTFAYIKNILNLFVQKEVIPEEELEELKILEEIGGKGESHFCFDGTFKLLKESLLKLEEKSLEIE